MTDFAPELRLTLEQKVGQTLMIAFEGTALTPALQQMIVDKHIGGVVLFEGNVESPRQLAQLTFDIQRTAKESGHPGLFVAIDQEGGLVTRLREARGFTEFPSAMAVAATNDVENASLIAGMMGSELSALGLNTNFAPVLDVNNNPANPVIGIRAFSSDPYRVADYGAVFAAALQGQNILAIGKHFPGHGDTTLDSHTALPTVAHNRAHLEAVELLPFKACLTADIAGIMSAHITFPAIDPTPGRPATLSTHALTKLLREEMGFEGLVCTDSLEMGALAASGYPQPLAAAMAFEAGADLLLFNANHAEHRQAFDLILSKVQNGEIPGQRLDDSLRRLLTTKKKFGLIDPKPIHPGTAAAHVGTSDHRARSRRIAAQAITLLRDDVKVLPLVSTHPVVIETPTAAGLAERLGATLIPIGEQPTHAEIISIVAALRSDQPIVVGVADVLAHPQQVALVNALMETKAPVIVVGLHNPYDLLPFARLPTLVAAYGANEPALEALARVLSGRARPQGRLPVTLPSLYHIGYGLSNFVGQS